MPAAIRLFASALTTAPLAMMAITPAVASDTTYFSSTKAPKPACPKWQAIQRRLDLYAALADGWDGGGAQRVSASVIDRAKQAAAFFERRAVKAPELGLSSDGEIDFVWDGDDASSSIAFLRSGEVLGFAYAEEWDAPVRWTSRVFDVSELEPVVLAALKTN